MGTGEIRTVAASWSQHLREVPLDRIGEVYAATVGGAQFPPAVADFLATWRIIADSEARAYQATEWQRHDNEVRKALPQGDGPGRRAMLAHRARLVATNGAAVVCKCEPKNGYDWPAQILEGENAWVCVQSPSCGFYLPVEQTMNAPEPMKRGPISPDEITMPSVPAPQFSSGLQTMAADANVDLEAMTPQQLADFRAFYKWWRDSYSCRLTPELMTEYYPQFEAQREKVNA